MSIEDTVASIQARAAALTSGLETYSNTVSNAAEPDTANIVTDFVNYTATAQTSYTVAHEDTGFSMKLTETNATVGSDTIKLDISGTTLALEGSEIVIGDGITVSEANGIMLEANGQVTIIGGSISLSTTGNLTLKGTDWDVYTANVEARLDALEDYQANVEARVVALESAP